MSVEDEFGPYLEQQLLDPVFRGHYEDAGTRHDILAGLIDRRKRAGLTQRQVAEQLEVCLRTLVRFEAGQDSQWLSRLQRYARAVGARITIGIEDVTE